MRTEPGSARGNSAVLRMQSRFEVCVTPLRRKATTGPIGALKAAVWSALSREKTSESRHGQVLKPNRRQNGSRSHPEWRRVLGPGHDIGEVRGGMEFGRRGRDSCPARRRHRTSFSHKQLSRWRWPRSEPLPDIYCREGGARLTKLNEAASERFGFRTDEPNNGSRSERPRRRCGVFCRDPGPCSAACACLLQAPVLPVSLPCCGVAPASGPPRQHEEWYGAPQVHRGPPANMGTPVFSCPPVMLDSGLTGI
ncbi:unnamed protein product [Arctogadus glacialis]